MMKETLSKKFKVLSTTEHKSSLPDKQTTVQMGACGHQASTPDGNLTLTLLEPKENEAMFIEGSEYNVFFSLAKGQ
jgi:hypothetical protein